MKILITGASGFVAPHLVQYIQTLKEKHEISLMARPHSDGRRNLRLKDIDTSNIDFYLLDLNFTHHLFQALDRIKPDVIFHLAAQSFVGQSFQIPTYTFETNTLMASNLLEWLRVTKNTTTKILLAGSSEEYGLVARKDLPIAEVTPLRPLSPYAVSKIAVEMMGYQYHQSYGTHTILTRAFNHEGPGRGEQFFTSSVCKQIVAHERGETPAEIQVGNLTAIRDITHVYDMVRAYWLAVEKCDPGKPYNICSGLKYSMQRLLDEALRHTTLKFKIIQDPERMRPSDVPILQGDYHKFYEVTRWHPRYRMEDVMRDTLEYWRAQ